MFCLGKKIKMSQIWKEQEIIPVTVIKVAPNKISSLKNKEKDGYEAVQLSLNKIRREFRTANLNDFKVGDAIDISIFNEGDFIKVSGLSKGRGFQGVVKRHGFRGGPKTHGQKDRLRAPGSIGTAGVQRVVPGRKMAGRMGSDRITVKNLEVVKIDKDSNLVMVKGAIPGRSGGLIEIRKMKK